MRDPVSSRIFLQEAQIGKSPCSCLIRDIAFSSSLVEGEVVVRLMMPLSLSYDHRLVDGATAARFLNEVIGFLEAPGRLLLAP